MFTLFFAGGLTKEPDNYMMKNGCSRLFSQLVDKNGINRWTEFLSCAGKDTASKLFIDSGAFTAKTQGVVIDVRDYVKFLNDNGEIVNRFANLDVIPNSQSYADIAEGAEKGYQNFMYIMENCKYREKCIAVYHKNDPVSVLHKYIEFYKLHPEMKYFALGGIVGGDPSSATEFAVKYCDIIKRELPNVEIHLFGYTRLRNLPYIHCDSVDSTSWIMAASGGLVRTKFGILPVSDIQKKMKSSVHNYPKKTLDAFVEYVETRGFTLKQLSEDYKMRMIFNIGVFKEWADNYVYLGHKKTKTSLI